MSTRGCIGFRKDGKDVLQYNHSDSYPDWLGRRMLEYLTTHTPDQMAEVAARVKVVTEDYAPTAEEIEAHAESLNLDVNAQSADAAYCLLREAQGDLAYYDDPRHTLWMDYAGFMADSLFCEWAYVINLDEGTLEVYKGFNQDPAAPGRYAALGDGGDYCGVALVKAYPLGSLPSGDTLVAECDPPEN